MGSPYHVSGSASRHFPHDQSSAEYKALSIIAKLLEHPQRTILSTFIQQAFDKELAAQFLLAEISGHENDTITEFLADWISLLKKVRPVVCKELNDSLAQSVWRRDGGKCCISKVQVDKNVNEGSTFVYIMPPSLFKDGDMVSNKRLHRILAAYIGDERLEKLRSLLDYNTNSSHRDLTSQIILLSTKVFEQVRNGRLSLKASLPAATEFSARYLAKTNAFLPLDQVETPRFITLENQAVDLTSLTSAQLLEAHHHFADALAWLEVSEYMKQEHSTSDTLDTRDKASYDKKGPGKKSWSQWCLNYISRTILHLWIQLPVAVRAFTYKSLASVSCRFYGYTGSDRTYRLPFNLYLRMASSDWSSKHQAEYQALKLVQKYTLIPAPRAIDVIKCSDSSFFLMTGLPGRGVGLMLPTMTDKQVDAIVQELKVYIAELRQIPNKTNSGFQICNALGGGILDWRIGDSQREELRFRDEKEFNQYLIRDLPLDEDMRGLIAKSHCVQHDIVFTHADLNLRNILVGEDMKISGIVDWECAGWYPGYWECSKAHFTVRHTARWIADVVDQVFPQYRDEVRAEDVLSSLAPSW
ncbi:hypothetical protein T440DRAFT_550000 [Plenodomus tracheiphilus IPT5]|uniref:Aminoglycoside phosphotransferase domain-containing protein n=1 Tax=Plenodomus tracheiphilus IPT5 TaxID=1408161 RepID=A0A6A7BP26_9PLEO|nr:hypothetical protein T440DRAFT_550000 [Plenodomus tracheiphilus IPT5]